MDRRQVLSTAAGQWNLQLSGCIPLKKSGDAVSDNLYSLMSDSDFRQFVGEDIWKRLDYIRACGNTVAHTSRKSGRDEAMLCLENLAIFLDFVACCYSRNYQEHIFDRGIINARIEKIKKSKQEAAAVHDSQIDCDECAEIQHVQNAVRRGRGGLAGLGDGGHHADRPGHVVHRYQPGHQIPELIQTSRAKSSAVYHVFLRTVPTVFSS